MFVVDSSVWVSRFVPADTQYLPSQQWLSLQIQEEVPLIEPYLLLPEVAGPIARRTGSAGAGRFASNAIGQLTNVTLVPVDADLAGNAAIIAADLRIRGADAVYVSLARQLGIELITWDLEQIERSGAMVRARTPSDLLPAS